jgi:hypothetical protein
MRHGTLLIILERGNFAANAKGQQEDVKTIAFIWMMKAHCVKIVGARQTEGSDESED